MSAILGRIELSGRPVDRDGFHAAFAALAPYGGNGGGCEIEGAVALGQQYRHVGRHRPQAPQPLRDGALTLVCDAILDNRDALAGSLGLGAGEVPTLSDAALILRSFRKWGDETPRHLLGDFAFAIWDADRRRLFLACDHIGARPLHWALRNGVLAFSTDVSGLLAFADLDWQIDEGAVARYLMQPDIPAPKGFLRDQFTLGPGRCVAIQDSAVRESVWWSPQTIAAGAPAPRGDDMARLRDLLETAVACRIDTDLAVGSHLSGGVDSTAVTVLAGRQLRREGRALSGAYSWSPPVTEDWPDIGSTDERRRIAAICATEDITCRFLDADLGAIKLAALHRPIETEGTADVSEELAVIAQARQDGIGVMLSGWGGDECVSAHGFGYMAFLLRRGRIGHAIGIARRHAGGFRRTGVLLETLLRHGLLPLLPDAIFRRFSGHPDIYPDRCFLSDGLLSRSGLTPGPSGPLVRETADPRLYLQRLLGFGHIATRMQTWATWGAPAGVTYRYPLTDRRLLEFLLSLPTERLFAKGAPRALMRAALADVLPAKMPKADPVQQALRDRMRQDGWRGLQAAAPKFVQAECPWLDMTQLRGRIDTMPQDETVRAMRFAEMSGALRVLSLYERWYERI